MVSVIVIFALTIITLILMVIFKPNIRIGKHYFESFWIVALVGAFLMLILRVINMKEIFNGLTQNEGINPIKLLTIFISMSGLSIMLEELGFFKKVANAVLKKAGNSQIKIFVYLYMTVAFLTIFTSNDIIILTFTPMICYFAMNAKINPIPYLIAEFVAANTWSLMFIIGNPTNLYLASSININFMEYFKTMFIPTILIGFFSFILLYLMFRKSLQQKIVVEHVEDVHIKDRFLVISTLLHLIVCTILLSISNYIHMEMFLICLVFFISSALVILIYELIHFKHQTQYILSTLKRIPWNLMPFVISMFIMVIGLNKYGITAFFKDILTDHTLFRFGITSFVSSNLLNNIPMSVMYANIITYVPISNANQIYQAIYSSIIGSNIGAYLSPIGALAGIMWMRMLKHENINLSYVDFIKYGGMIAIPTMLFSLVILSFAL